MRNTTQQSSKGQAALAVIAMCGALVFGAPALDAASMSAPQLAAQVLQAGAGSTASNLSTAAVGLVDVVKSAQAAKPAAAPQRKASLADANGVIRITPPPMAAPRGYNDPQMVRERELVAADAARVEAEQQARREEQQARAAERQARLDEQRALLEARQAAVAMADQVQ